MSFDKEFDKTWKRIKRMQALIFAIAIASIFASCAFSVFILWLIYSVLVHLGYIPAL